MLLCRAYLFPTYCLTHTPFPSSNTGLLPCEGQHLLQNSVRKRQPKCQGSRHLESEFRNTLSFMTFSIWHNTHGWHLLKSCTISCSKQLCTIMMRPKYWVCTHNANATKEMYRFSSPPSHHLLSYAKNGYVLIQIALGHEKNKNRLNEKINCFAVNGMTHKRLLRMVVICVISSTHVNLPFPFFLCLCYNKLCQF